MGIGSCNIRNIFGTNLPLEFICFCFLYLCICLCLLCIVICTKSFYIVLYNGHNYCFKLYSPFSVQSTQGRPYNYSGALCETDCVGPSLGRNKDNNYSRDKRGAYGSAGPTADAYVAVA